MSVGGGFKYRVARGVSVDGSLNAKINRGDRSDDGAAKDGEEEVSVTTHGQARSGEELEIWQDFWLWSRECRTVFEVSKEPKDGRMQRVHPEYGSNRCALIKV